MAVRKLVAKGLFWADGRWHSENPPIVGPGSHAFWMASVVFDGARSIQGMVPDLDLHCRRVIESAHAFGLKPMVRAGEIYALCVEGVRQLPRSMDLYIRPAFHAEEGFVSPDPDSTRFTLSLLESPMPEGKGLSVCLSSFRRPARDMAPTDAKAACLYPNSARALAEARAKGFDNCVMKDPVGNVAELATANIWIVKDGVAITPAENGTFLAGITRFRIRELLRANNVPVLERVVEWQDVLEADEVFSTGNYGKVVPVTRVENRDLQPGPVTRKARALYMGYAQGFSLF